MSEIEFVQLSTGTAVGVDGAIPCFLGGDFEAPEGPTNRIIECRDPNTGAQRAFNGSHVRHVRPASDAQVERALAAAASSKEWALVPLEARLERLTAAAAALDAAACPGFAWTDAMETGVPISITPDIASGFAPVARDALNSAAAFLRHEADTPLPGRHGTIRTHRVPQSPSVIIAPWNVPVGTIVPKLFVALLSGCNVIVKPSEYASTTVTAAVGVIAKAARLPAAALQSLTGPGSTGCALVSDRRVRSVQFTGAPATAANVAEACAPRLCPLLAECGGSNAAIVGLHADLALSADRIAFGMTTLNGQWCMGVSRILVHGDVADRFLALLAAQLEAEVLVVHSQEAADAAAPSEGGGKIHVGPLAFADHAQRLRATIAKLGGEPREFGRVSARAAQCIRDAGRDKERPGCFVRPTLVVGASPDACAAVELFGPVASFHRFGSWEEAVAMANTASGQLASYVFIGDGDPRREELVTGLLPQLRTGMVMLESINFCFEAQEPHHSPASTFLDTAGHGVDGSGESLAAFFTARQCVGVNGPSKHA